MIIGVPKEIKEQEYRVALLPSAAYQLIKRGHQVLVERGAGDGSGYPDHLRAVEIPLEARILAVCDAFDAMISDRPYRPALTIDAALVEIEACMGTQFDPSVVEVFLRTMGRDFTGV